MVYHKALEIFCFITLGALFILTLERLAVLPNTCVISQEAYDIIADQEPLQKKR